MFYSAPRHPDISVTLVSGYTEPTGTAVDAMLVNTGTYEYAPSRHPTIDATLTSGYTEPTGTAADATLTRSILDNNIELIKGTVFRVYSPIVVTGVESSVRSARYHSEPVVEGFKESISRGSYYSVPSVTGFTGDLKIYRLAMPNIQLRIFSLGPDDRFLEIRPQTYLRLGFFFY